jgi:hypothetical protein
MGVCRTCRDFSLGAVLEVPRSSVGQDGRTSDRTAVCEAVGALTIGVQRVALLAEDEVALGIGHVVA